MDKLRAWYQAARPFTLSAALTPVLVGSSLAFQIGTFSPGLFGLVLLGCLLVQVAANLVDEYSDHKRPEGRQKLLAPYKVIALGLLSGRAVKLGAFACFGAATAIGIYLVAVTGWPILIASLASGAMAYLYSGGPKPLGSIALGHPVVFLFMGPVMVIGAYYVQTQAYSAEALWLSLPVGCTVTAILVANDLRDLEEDRSAGKTTPIGLLGRAFGRWEWTLLVVAAFAIVVALVVTGTTTPLSLAVLLSSRQSISALRAIWAGRERAELARALPASARLHGEFGALLALGVALGRYVAV